MERRTVSVSGMACGGCEDTVENALQALGGVNRVEADHESDSVDVVTDESVDDDAIRTAVEDAGYEVVG